MKSLYESIIKNTDIGIDVMIKGWVEKNFKINDKLYDIDNGFVYLWGTGVKELWISDMPSYIKFTMFDPGEISIYINGDDEYATFLNSFNCMLGSYSEYARNNKIEVYIYNVSTTIKWNDTRWPVYGKIHYENCKCLDFAGGLPNVFGQLICKKCKDIKKPRDLQDITEIKFK